MQATEDADPEFRHSKICTIPAEPSWAHCPFNFISSALVLLLFSWFGPDKRDAEGFHHEKHFRVLIGSMNAHGQYWKQTNVESRTIRSIFLNKWALKRSNLREFRKTKQASWVWAPEMLNERKREFYI